MHQFALKFHHFGLASKRPELTLSFLKGLGYAIEGKAFDPMQNVSDTAVALHDHMRLHAAF